MPNSTVAKPKPDRERCRVHGDLPGDPCSDLSCNLCRGARSAPSSTGWKRSTLIDISILALLAVAIRLPWIFMIPVSEAPDEGAHLWVLRFVSERLSLPQVSDMAKDPHAAYYGSFLPFSYIMHVVCRFAMPWFNADLAFRFGSLITGVLGVLAGYGVGRELFNRSRWLALSVPLFLAFHPQMVFVNGYSNNDSQTFLISTLAIYACIVGIKNGITRKTTIAFGLVCAALALSKLTAYCLFPVILFSLLASYWLHKTPIRTAATQLLTIGLLTIGIAGPFFMYNSMRLDGDFTGMKTMLGLWWQANGKPAQLYHWPVVDNRDWRYCTFISYFGNFGNMNRLMPGKIYKFYALAVNLAAAGWLLMPVLAGLVRNYRERLEINKIQVTLWAMLIVSLGLNFVGLVIGSTSLNSTGPPQGRYLFPSEVSIASLLVGGLSFIGGRYLVALFVIFNVVSCLISLGMLSQIYHFDTNIMR